MIAAWLTLQLAVVAAWAALVLVERLELAPADAQRSGRLAVVLALLAPLLLFVAPEAAPYEAPAQLWSAGEGARLELRAPGEAPRSPAALTVPLPEAPPLAPALALGLLVVAAQLIATRRRIATTAPLRRLGALELRVGEGPYALWWPGRCVVVLAPQSLAAPEALRMTLRHEVQHHRSGDTRFAWVLAALRLLSWPNPAAKALAARLRALDELACDAALVRTQQVEPRAYAHLLLAAATGAPQPGPAPLSAVGLHHPTLLRRRILMLTRPTPARRGGLLALGLPLALVLGAVLLAEPLAADHRLDAAAVDAAALELEAAGFPASTHPDVLAQAERFAASPARLSAALERRAAYEAVAADALERHGVPQALLAIPLVESGWRNLPSSANPIGAAGLWQFIAPTAEDYGLRVDAQVDERLDVALASDAAARLLADLYQRFGDWGLAVAAYNAGGQRVELAMKAQGTSDVRALIAAGALPDYANAVYAAALVERMR